MLRRVFAWVIGKIAGTAYITVTSVTMFFQDNPLVLGWLIAALVLLGVCLVGC